MRYTIAAFYRFVPLHDIAVLRATLLSDFASLNLCGTLLLASEGINGTLAGHDDDVGVMLGLLQEKFGLLPEDVKRSYAEEKPFNRLKIRIKREIITFQQAGADPTHKVGTYVAAKDWNSLTDDPCVTVLDTRNTYETRIGSFSGARIPPITSFTEFAHYVRAHLDPARHKKVAMFCTGGIRCEKASAFMLSEGFEEVYHLKGGILKYLEDVPVEKSKWNGECYVFDRRVAVGHRLTTGRYSMCFTCGTPLQPKDKEHPSYEEGVACAACHATTSEADKARFRMRQSQLVTEHTAVPKELS